MKSRATSSPARSAHASAVCEGMARLLSLAESYGWVNFVRTERRRALSMRVRELAGGLWWGGLGVWTVSTLWVADWAVPVPDWPGFRMFRRDSSVGKGRNPVRVPPRAQCFRRSVAFWCFFRVDSVHTLGSDLMFRGVWGPGNGLFGCVRERLPTAGRVPSRGVSLRCSALVKFLRQSDVFFFYAAASWRRSW